MACGIALKRSLELDPVHGPDDAKRRKTTFSPIRPSFSACSNSQPMNSNASYHHWGQIMPSHTPMNTDQLERIVLAEARRLRRRRLIPRRDSDSPGGTGTPNSSSDSDGEHHKLQSSCQISPSSLISQGTLNPHQQQQPQQSLVFTLKQVRQICEYLLREQEQRLRDEYGQVLAQKLQEQYETFVQFAHDQIHRTLHPDNASSCMFIYIA